MTKQKLYSEVLLQEAKRIRKFISENESEIGATHLKTTANILEVRAKQLLNNLSSNGTPLS